MNHCNICGNNIPDETKTCEEAGFGDGCGKTMNTTPDIIEEKVAEMVEDGGIIYEATVREKKLLLELVYKVYEAGKNRDDGAFFDTRREILQTLYAIQRKSGTTIYQRGREDERERCANLAWEWFQQWLKDNPVIRLDKAQEIIKEHLSKEFQKENGFPLYD